MMRACIAFSVLCLLSCSSSSEPGKAPDPSGDGVPTGGTGSSLPGDHEGADSGTPAAKTGGSTASLPGSGGTSLTDAAGGTSTAAGSGGASSTETTGGTMAAGGATGGTPPAGTTGGTPTADVTGGAAATDATGGSAATDVTGGASATDATGGTVATGGVTDPGSGGSGSVVPGTTDPNNGAAGADGPIGFAAIAGLGLDTTTGGVGGPVVTVTTLEDLSVNMDSDAPMVIVIDGAIDLGGGMVTLRSDKTLIGLDGARLHNGGLEMYRRQNIIIRNIVFADGTDDTIKINQDSHHIWVDHCDLTNAPDGLFDITRRSSHITISWNHFYNHSKTMLIGHSDSATDDTGYLKTTIHHNWFDGTEQRHPRVRFGEVHVFNNYFLSNGLYGVASTMEADVVVEGNYFEAVAYPTYSGYAESAPGDIVERNNVYDNSGTPQTRGTAFDPTAAYPYVVEDPTTLREAIRANAGVGVIDPQAVIAAAAP